MRIERISSKMTAVSLEFIENLRKHWLQVLLIWVTIGLSYLYFGGSFCESTETFIVHYRFIIFLDCCNTGKFYNKIAISIVISGSLLLLLHLTLIFLMRMHICRALYVADFSSLFTQK